MIVLLSGGIDSIATWRLMGLPDAVHFDLGTRSAWHEQQAVDWASVHFARRYIHSEINMGHAEHASGWTDFRNSILILAAAQYDADVALGAVAEFAPDKNRLFYRRLERAANMRGRAARNRKSLRVHTPFAHLSKGSLLLLYRERFGAEETRLLLQNARSCYADGGLSCGECGACRQRVAAEHEYAARCGEVPPGCTAARWEIPWQDRLRWVRSNGWLGVRQIRAHTRADDYLPPR